MLNSDAAPCGAGPAGHTPFRVPAAFRWWIAAAAICLSAATQLSCNLYYGEIGGADVTTTIGTSDGIAGILGPKTGVWYSHYAKKRLDGYTIGQWKNIGTNLNKKLDRFTDFNAASPHLHDDYVPQPEDYYLFYDDAVYGQNENGSGAGNGGWGYGYLGIVRAVNIFNGNADTGAIIIEYFDGCYPAWSAAVKDTPLPFFGVYYRVLKPDVIQMANAIVLENLYKGKPYHTETKTLEEAIVKNNAENDGEFISWGVTVPQDREK
jgi:hypothetical protein